MGGGRSFGANISLPLRSADYPRNQPARKEGTQGEWKRDAREREKKRAKIDFSKKKTTCSLHSLNTSRANVRECNSSDLLFAALRIFFFFS